MSLLMFSTSWHYTTSSEFHLHAELCGSVLVSLSGSVLVSLSGSVLVSLVRCKSMVAYLCWQPTWYLSRVIKDYLFFFWHLIKYWWQVHITHFHTDSTRIHAFPTLEQPIKYMRKTKMCWAASDSLRGVDIANMHRIHTYTQVDIHTHTMHLMHIHCTYVAVCWTASESFK